MHNIDTCLLGITSILFSIISLLSSNTAISFLTILAILLAPRFALQAQVKHDSLKEQQQRRLHIFKTLIATYATRLSPDHVQALNLINIEFYGINNVIKAWETYLDHLNKPSTGANDPHLSPEKKEEVAQEWINEGNRLLNDLLVDISKEVGLPFDKSKIEKGVYYTSAQGKLEYENRLMREGLLNIISNKSSISMNVVSLPIDKEASDKQQKLQDSLIDYYDGKKSVKVTLENKKD
jgi:hypothetical protein